MKLSVIIPIYNSEATLCRCIDSVLAQRMSDWELILINDGSKDGSLRICEDYASMDSRIRVLNQMNSGVSVARNNGIAAASGEYITFLDSDDYLEGDSFDFIVESSCDLIVFESISRKKDNSIKFWYSFENHKIIDSNEKKEFIKKYITTFVLDGPCAKFLKKEAIGKIRFPVGQKLGEDNVFMLKFIKECISIELKRNAFYVIVEHDIPGNIRYRMSAEHASRSLEAIMNAYNLLDIECPNFERIMFESFYSVIPPLNCTEQWYNNKIIQSLERKYLKEKSLLYQLFYFCSRYIYIMHIYFALQNKYGHIRIFLKKYLLYKHK